MDAEDASAAAIAPAGELVGQRRATSRSRVVGVTALLVLTTIVLSVGINILMQRQLLRHEPFQVTTFTDYLAEQRQPWFIVNQVVSTELVIALPLAMAVGYGLALLRLRAAYRAMVWLIVPCFELVALIVACLTFPATGALLRLIAPGSFAGVSYSVPQIAHAFVALPAICGLLVCLIALAGLVSVGCAWLFAPWRRLSAAERLPPMARTLAVGGVVFVVVLFGWSALQTALEAAAQAFDRQAFYSLAGIIVAYVVFWLPGPVLVAGGYAIAALRSLRPLTVAARQRGIESLSDEDVVFTRERLI